MILSCGISCTKLLIYLYSVKMKSFFVCLLMEDFNHRTLILRFMILTSFHVMYNAQQSISQLLKTKEAIHIHV